jgi:hypothetical protein
MFNDDRNGGTGGESGLAKTFDASARPVLAVDVKKYEALLDDPSLSEAQKEEFLRALWSVVVTFVELGFGVRPLQEVCGQDSGDSFPGAKDAFDQVKSNELVETQDDRDTGQIPGVEKHEYT